MEEAFRTLAVRGVHWFDVLDVLAVTALFLLVFRQVRGTRSLHMLIGVVVLAVANALSGLLEMTATHRLLQNVLFYIPFAVIVLFQEPIRKFLATLGGTFFGYRAGREATSRVARETANASFILAELRYGAIILLERSQGLKDYAETGIRVGAEVSSDLLVTLFYPGTPLHDGAALIVEGQVMAASCFLPLTSGALPTTYGTRHRAAVGITEITDAICVVVSEERGVVSLAMNGRLETVDSSDELERRLTDLLGGKPVESPAAESGS